VIYLWKKSFDKKDKFIIELDYYILKKEATYEEIKRIWLSAVNQINIRRINDKLKEWDKSKSYDEFKRELFKIIEFNIDTINKNKLRKFSIYQNYDVEYTIKKLQDMLLLANLTKGESESIWESIMMNFDARWKIELNDVSNIEDFIYILSDKVIMAKGKVTFAQVFGYIIEKDKRKFNKEDKIENDKQIEKSKDKGENKKKE